MALSASAPFASFDVTDGAQKRDISPILEDAIYYDLNLLSAVGVSLGNPVFDNRHYWNEEAIDVGTFTVNGALSDSATSWTLDAGHNVTIGDLVYDTASGSTEVCQITATGATTATAVRAHNGTAALAILDDAVLGIIRGEQEGSDIGVDSSQNPTVRSNYTQILNATDLLVSGTQIARKMATTELNDFVARQLAALILSCYIANGMQCLR